MSISEEDLVREVSVLSVQRLHRWIRLGLVRPERRKGAAHFHDVDVARVRFLCDLEHDLELDEDTMRLVLSLVDQVHGLRNELRNMVAAIDEQTPAVRERIAHAFARLAQR